MSKLSYTAKLTLSITIKEVLSYGKSLVAKDALKKAIKGELMQCVEGIIGGDYGGSYCDWKSIFFNQLKNQKILLFNEKGNNTWN